MFLLGILYLAVAAVASPVIPDPPALPERGKVLVESSIFPIRVDGPKVVRLIEMEHEEKKDENEALRSYPEAPMLPPLDESILENIKKIEIKPDESPKLTVEIPMVEVLKVEEPKKDEKNKIKEDAVEVKIKDLVQSEKPVIVQWSMPSAPLLSDVISTIPHIPLPLPTLNWPFQVPTIMNPPRIRYPGYVIEEQLL